MFISLYRRRFLMRSCTHMAISSWLRPLGSLLSTPCSQSRRRLGKCRLTIEALEDRCVPSTFAVVKADDNVVEHGTLRWAVANAVSGDTILIAADLKDTPIVLT